jgi:hypothetical protein
MIQNGLFSVFKTTKIPINPNAPTFDERVVRFYESLRANDDAFRALPDDVGVLNPYTNPATMSCVEQFCATYYHDNIERVGCFGINPGRFGGGLTGLAFTDPVTLRDVCGIENTLGFKREVSAEFVWRVVEAFGGAEAFFAGVFLTAMCPLGLVRNPGEHEVNYNFYDDKATMQALIPFIERTLHQQIALGLRQDVAVCFGTGKLQASLTKLNNKLRCFDRIIAVEHPRFIMQYRRGEIGSYVQKYVATLRDVV